MGVFWRTAKILKFYISDIVVESKGSIYTQTRQGLSKAYRSINLTSFLIKNMEWIVDTMIKNKIPNESLKFKQLAYVKGYRWKSLYTRLYNDFLKMLASIRLPNLYVPLRWPWHIPKNIWISCLLLEFPIWGKGNLFF